MSKFRCKTKCTIVDSLICCYECKQVEKCLTNCFKYRFQGKSFDFRKCDKDCWSTGNE